MVLIKAVKSDREMASEKSSGQKSSTVAILIVLKWKSGLNVFAHTLLKLWVIHEVKHLMHLFGLLFHFPFYHESPLKCLFDWNRPCCSHTLLRLLSISQLPPVWSLFSFCSSAAELVHCLASLLLSSLITYLHSFSLIQHQMKEPPHPSTHTLSLCWCLFVSCWLQTGKVEVFLCWEIQDSLPALILDNRKLTDCFLFSYWQLCLQRCLQMCGCNSVCRLEEEINQ